jgi:hypothetical protein
MRRPQPVSPPPTYEEVMQEVRTKPGNPYSWGMIRTFDLLVLTSSDQLLLILKKDFSPFLQLKLS